MPIPVAALPKAYVCGLSLAWIAGSNPAGGCDVCIEISAKSQSFVQRSLEIVVCLSVVAEPQRRSLGPVVLSSYAKKENAFAGIFKKQNYLHV
jgi:hypothetical protein